jgi:hypothetical protein
LAVSSVQTVTAATPTFEIFNGSDIVLGTGMQTPVDTGLTVRRTIQGYPLLRCGSCRRDAHARPAGFDPAAAARDD